MFSVSVKDDKYAIECGEDDIAIIHDALVDSYMKHKESEELRDYVRRVDELEDTLAAIMTTRDTTLIIP